MKIRFLTSCMSAEGVFTAGREYVMGDALAAGFIAAGHAVEAPAAFEEATLPEEPLETSIAPKPSRKRK